MGLIQHPFIKKMPEGFLMRLSLEDHIEKQLFWYGSYEQKEMQVLLKFIQSDALVIDIGANIGYVSLLASSVVVNGTVVAFEPGIVALERLHQNLALNPSLKIIVIPKALGNQVRECAYYPSSDENLGMSGLTPAENFSGKKDVVAMTTLDLVAAEQGWPKIDVVKLDVEGAELLVLQGMKSILTNFRPSLFIEIASSNLARFHHNSKQLMDYLGSFDYQSFEILGTGLLKKTTDLSDASLIVFQPIEKAFPATIRELFIPTAGRNPHTPV